LYVVPTKLNEFDAEQPVASHVAVIDLEVPEKFEDGQIVQVDVADGVDD